VNSDISITKARAIAAPLLRTLLVFSTALLLVGLFLPPLQELNWVDISADLGAFPPRTWGLAAVFVAISFVAVSVYDIFALRATLIRCSEQRAFCSGFMATATAQFVGFGLISGALMRWRVLGGLGISFRRAIGLTLFVSGGFCFLALYWSLGFQLIWRFGWTGGIGFGLLTGMCLLFYGWIGCTFSIRGRVFRLPGLRVVLAFGLLCAVDLVASALAFWCFLPTESTDFIGFLAMFPLALLAGLMSAIPGGAGAMDLALISVFPGLSAQSLITAMIAYRMIAIAIPGVLAFVMLILLELTSDRGRPAYSVAPPPSSVEAAIGGHCLIALGQRSGLVGGFARLAEQAKLSGLFACHYGADEYAAQQARAAGFMALPIGAEAVIDPGTFTFEGRKKSRLRRKLRLAERAGLSIESSHQIDLAIDDLAEISKAWCRSKGQERGFTMSRFEAAALSGVEVFVARLRGNAVGFATFRTIASSWELDLIRLSPKAPDGTGYALVTAAIKVAAKAGSRRFSLAAVPFYVPETPRCLIERTCDFIFDNANGLHKAKGLLHFKDSFGPAWQQRYLVARNPGEALIAALEVIRNVRKGVAGVRAG